MQNLKKRKRILVGVCSIFVLISILSIVFLSRSTYSLLDNHVRVAENTELTYYLDIIYDGKDKDIIMSSDSATADIRSDYIYIEDKIPDGLTFVGFVQSSDGSIGAVKRSDGTTTCGGYVVDGVQGLVYDEETRTVSFRVKNLQAGCKLTVGIITRTPLLGERKRMDFYNTAFGREKTFTANSNTVHVYLGRDTIDRYAVTYRYTGTVPTGAPQLPEAASYAQGTDVGLMNDIVVPGYTFSGWTSSDVNIQDSAFSMPNKDVVIEGSFSKNQTYNVSYRIDGAVQPPEYALPNEKEYSVGDEVFVDSLKIGDIISGYRFLGWNSTDVTVSDGVFQMPNKAVVFVGSFEQVKYKVTYQFQGNIIPTNAQDLLPTERTYVPGEIVNVEQNPVATGYEFLGWYKTENFEMPEEDVVIYGEWMLNLGSFAPTIAMSIVDDTSGTSRADSGKRYYSQGDKVQFSISVTNTADFPIHDVMLQEQMEGAKFTAGTGYTILNNSHVKIDTIPAGGSVTVLAEYTVGSQAFETISNTVVLTGALAENNYYLDTTKEYKSTITFDVVNTSLEIITKDAKNTILEGAVFSLYEDRECTDLVKSGLTFDKLMPNTTYYLKETTVPDGYISLNGILEVRISSSGVVSIPNYTIDGDNGRYSVIVYNQKINILPNTGGIGTVPFIVGGIVLMIGAGTGYIYFTKKKSGGSKNGRKNKK